MIEINVLPYGTPYILTPETPMDKENRIPLKFLDEAEDCCDRIESTAIGLADRIPDPQKLDLALRAAHSIKGSAAMMGFMPLSQVAHQLEDSFKILRVRYHSKSINTDVETLLLQGVDCLRQVCSLHRQGTVIDDVWFATQSQPIFDRLREYLGELRPEDEDALLSEEGDIDPAILLFESGVKEVLDLLDGKLTQLKPAQLIRELQMTADELSDFGKMAKLDRFVDLCQSVKSQLQSVQPDLIGLAHKALKTWRKSHSLVLLGRFDRLPDRLDRFQNALEQLELDRENPASGMDSIVDLQPINLSELQLELANLTLHNDSEFAIDFDEIQLPSELISELTFDAIASLSMPMPNWEANEQPDFTNHVTEQLPKELLSELVDFEMPELPSAAMLNWDDDRSTIAFHIDRFWGEQEVTLRSIDCPMPLTPGFGNSIILGDGRVVALVDLIQLGEWMSATFGVDALSPALVDKTNSLATRTQTNTILVIDDSINVRRYLAAMLEKEGYQVEQASDGRDAVDKLLGGLVVQAAICDIEMPRLDGYGVLETLRSHENFEELPILMLTSRNSEKHRMLAMNLGASAYFSKPYTEPELLETLRSLVEIATQKESNRSDEYLGRNKI